MQLGAYLDIHGTEAFADGCAAAGVQAEAPWLLSNEAIAEYRYARKRRSLGDTAIR